MKYFTLFITLLLIQEIYSQCVGSSYCTVCKNCSRCRYCKAGGTCGVCGGGRVYERPRPRSYSYGDNTSSGSSYSSSSSTSSSSTPAYIPIKSDKKRKKKHALNNQDKPPLPDTTNTRPDYNIYPASSYSSSSYSGENKSSGLFYLILVIVLFLVFGNAVKKK